ncbi:MAG: TatD family hydrolase [Acidimicrobiales bacterium]|nr:TatD family hydrolase [Acidimicrobiales bacterium]
MTGETSPDLGISEELSALRWIDDHCHVHHRGAPADQVASLVEDAGAGGVERLITVGCDIEDSRAAIAAAAAHENVFATAGVHPHEARHGIDGLEELLADPDVVAVGECGLDYFYEHSPRDAQREVFAAQIAMAFRHDLALVIHTRDAWDDTFDVLASEGTPERTVFHCFTGGPDEARRCLDLGAMLSFSGIVTFKHSDDLRAAAALCPLDRLLVETDSPYLTPHPHRGERNRPALVRYVGGAVAAAKGVTPAAVATATWDNAARTYRLPA